MRFPSKSKEQLQYTHCLHTSTVFRQHAGTYSARGAFHERSAIATNTTCITSPRLARYCNIELFIGIDVNIESQRRLAARVNWRRDRNLFVNHRDFQAVVSLHLAARFPAGIHTNRVFSERHTSPTCPILAAYDACGNGWLGSIVGGDEYYLPARCLLAATVDGAMHCLCRWLLSTTDRCATSQCDNNPGGGSFVRKHVTNPCSRECPG